MRRTLSKMHTTKFNEFDKDSDFSNVPSQEAESKKERTWNRKEKESEGMTYEQRTRKRTL